MYGITAPNNEHAIGSRRPPQKKNKKNIARIVRLVRNGENFKIHKIDCCEGGLQLSYIATDNVGENDLNPGMTYIMVRLDN